MARIEESIEIRCPVDKVFAYTDVAKDWPKWHVTIPEAEQTSEGPVGVGTTYKGKTRMWGQTWEWTAKLTEYEPYKRKSLIDDSGSVVIDEKVIFDAVESGTRFTIVYDIKVSGLLKLLSSRIDRSFRKQWKLNLISLKNILEAQQEESL
jgi:Polyketide cyclase / dehydrase and lipid transport